jgi:hypothetical protein
MDNRPIKVERKAPVGSDKVLVGGDRTMANVVKNMAKNGLTDSEIAKFVGARLYQLKRRLRKVSALKEALTEGRSEATQTAVNILFKTAIGGQVVQKIKERVNSKGEVTTEILTEELPPNPNMLVFWLVNNDPGNWKSTRQLAKEDMLGKVIDGKSAESDKIARLCREIFEGYTDGVEEKHRLSNATAHSTTESPDDEGDICIDVQGEATDSIQDDVLDIPAEEGAEPL